MRLHPALSLQHETFPKEKFVLKILAQDGKDTTILIEHIDPSMNPLSAFRVAQLTFEAVSKSYLRSSKPKANEDE